MLVLDFCCTRNPGKYNPQGGDIQLLCDEGTNEKYYKSQVKNELAAATTGRVTFVAFIVLKNLKCSFQIRFKIES